MALTFTPFVAGLAVESNTAGNDVGLNPTFQALYNLLGFTGSPGQLTWANFGTGGINASQINAGAVGGAFSNVAGNVSNTGSFQFFNPLTTPPSTVSTPRVTSTTATGGRLVFSGNNTDWVALDWASASSLLSILTYATIGTFSIKTGTAANPSSYGSLWSGYQKTGPAYGQTTHAVSGNSNIAGSTVTVTLTGDAVFSSASSYVVLFTVQTAYSGHSGISVPTLFVTYTSGSSFTISVAGWLPTGSINWIAIGS